MCRRPDMLPVLLVSVLSYSELCLTVGNFVWFQSGSMAYLGPDWILIMYDCKVELTQSFNSAPIALQLCIRKP